MKILRMKTKRILAGAAVAILLSQTILSDVSAAAFGMGRVYAAEEEVAAEQAPQEVASEPASEVKEEAPVAEEKATEVKEEASNGEEVVAESEVTGKDQQDVESETAESSKEETLAEETKEETVETETEETEETETEETEETEELCTKSVYTYSGNGVTVTATLSNPNVIPDDAEFRVTPITSGTAYNAYLAAMDKADSTKKHDAENTVLFDVAFLVNENGKLVEFEPEQGSVQIKITFNNKQLEKIDAKNEEVKIVHLPLKDSVMNRVDKTVDATNISAGDLNPEVLTEQKSSGETLTFSMDSFSVVGASATKAPAAVTFTEDLNRLVTEVTIQAQKDSNGNYVVEPGKNYKLKLRFDEKPNVLGFNNTSVVYTFPEGINPVDDRGTFDVRLGAGKTLSENVYEIKDSKIIVTWNKNDPNYSLFTASSQAWFELEADASVSENVSKIVFDSDVKKEYYFVQEQGTASIKKEAWVEEEKGIFHYTITATANGTVKNVKITDTLSNNSALAYQKDAKVNQSYKGASLTNTQNGKGFVYIVPELKSGQQVVITYTAKADYAKLAKNGKVTFEKNNTLNTATIETENNPPTSAEWYYTKDVQLSSLRKEKTGDSVSGNIVTATWTVTANEKMAISMAGQTITDMLKYESNNGMSNTRFAGNGIIVLVIKPDGSKEERILSWNQVSLQTDTAGNQNWSYKIPNSDANYKYVITYQTTSDTSTLVGLDRWTISNTVTDTFGDKAKVEMPLEPGEGQKTSLKKTGSRQSDNKGKWTITFDVPMAGLSSCVLEDELPHAWVDGHRYDVLDRDSLVVDGLQNGKESYDFYETRNENGLGFKLVFKKNGADGLNASNVARKITVSYTTTPDPVWLEKSKEDWQYVHENNAILTANNIKKTDDAKIIYPKKKGFEKRGRWYNPQDTNTRPIFVYDLILSGVDTDTITVNDVFDTSLFTTKGVEHHDAWGKKIFYADEGDPGLPGTDLTSMEETNTGVTITTKVPKKPDGTYYRTYKIVYFVTVKDDAAWTTLKNSAANAKGANVHNKATWDGLSDECDITYTYTPLTKEAYVEQKNGKNTNRVRFVLTVNSGAADLDPQSDTLELLDQCTNLTILPDFIQTTPSVNVTYDSTEDGYKFVIPDATALTLEYTCVVNHLENGTKASWSNTASLKGYRVEKRDSYEVYTSGAKGGAPNPGINIVKYAEGDQSKHLNGATFRLLNADKEPVCDFNGNEVTVTTSGDGKAELMGDSARYGWTLEYDRQYYLEEIQSPKGYVRSGELIPFTVSRDTLDTTRNQFTEDFCDLYVSNAEQQFTPIDVELQAGKTLNGREIREEEFAFTLSASNTEAQSVLATPQEVRNHGNTVTFQKIHIVEPGTYTFAIKEKAGDVPNVKYDSQTHTATIVVTEEENKTLHAVVTYDGGKASCNFTNTYTPTPVKANLSVDKVLIGRALKQDDFTFEVVDEAGKVVAQAKNPAASMTENSARATVNFDALTFDKAGTYRYIIREKKGNPDIGISYSEAQIQATVVVTDNGNGVLSAGVTYDGKDTVGTLTNTYESKPVSVVLHAAKELSGRNMEKDEFFFQVLDAEGNEVRRASAPNATMTDGVAKANITFAPIVISQEGEYNYTIKEIVGNKKNVTYDEKSHAVKVVVRDNQKGELKATVTYDGAEDIPVFTNNYKATPAEVSLKAKKVLTKTNGSRILKDGEFLFHLTALNDAAKKVLPETDVKTNDKEGKVEFKNLTFTEADTYTFQITEQNTNIPYIQYDNTAHTVTVVVVDDVATGRLVPTVTYDDGATDCIFTNNYTASEATANITGSKVLTGRDLTADAFSFVLEGEGIQETVKNNVEGKFAFTTLTYQDKGTYNYTVKEVNEHQGGIHYDESVFHVKVEVVDNDEGQLVATVTTTKSGATVSGIEFTNTYTATPTSAQFHAKKTLVGRDLVQGEFAFDLVDAQGTVVETIHAPKEDFSEITYETPGIYEYTIVEEIPAEAEVTEDGRKVYKGVTYDTKTVQVTVEVTDNKEGALQKTVTYKVNGSAIAEDYASFVNTYEAKPAEIRLEAAKELVGRNLVKGEFGFELKGTSENARGTKDTRTNSVETDGTGKVNFGTITYTQPGTYEYEIRELIPEGATLEADGFYHYKGITYDGTVYPVTVTVADTDAQGVKTGKLVASVRYEHVNAGTVPTFHNTYHGAPVKAQVKAEKTLVGRDLKANEFAFELVEAANQNTLPSGKVIVGNAVDGTVVFPEITYEEVGTYQYTVAEVVDSTKRSVVFDEKKHSVYVTVTEKVDENGTPIGQLQANVRYEVKDEGGLVSEELPRFVNETVLRNLKVRKSFLNQDNLAETGMVSFQLYRLENGKEVAVDGQTVTLTCANRDENGKYHWTQSELVGSFTGLQAYDENDQLISYMVKETTQGNFTIRYYDQDSRTANTDAAKYDAKSFVVGRDAEVVVENCEFTTYTGTKTWYDFHNKYGVRPGQIQVTLYQRLEGQDVSEAKAYTDKNGKTLTKAISGEDDTWEYSFEHLPIYDDNGVKYIYSVTEDYVTYDGHVTADSANLRYYTGDGNHTSVGFVSGDMNLNNTLTTVNVNGTKVWDDEWDSSKRPESIIVRLVANGAVLKDAQGNDICQEVTADAEGNWNFTFENVPNYYVTVDGEVQAAITYAVTEDPVEGYTAVVTGNAVDGFVITNTYETTKLAKAYIVKVDAADQNKALAGATFGLYHEDGSLVGFYTSDANGIVIADSLKEGNYFFRESAAPAGYKLNQNLIHFTITQEQDRYGMTLYVGKVVNEKNPTTPDNPGGDNPNTPEVLGAKRDILTPDQGQVLGVRRAPKTSDASKALLWMLVMGGSGIGAAIMMAQQRRSRNKLRSML